MGQIEIINYKARHNLMDAKYRWLSNQLDGAIIFREPLGQTKNDANPPGRDTKPPGGDNPRSLLFSSSI